MDELWKTESHPVLAPELQKLKHSLDRNQEARVERTYARQALETQRWRKSRQEIRANYVPVINALIAGVFLILVLLIGLHAGGAFANGQNQVHASAPDALQVLSHLTPVAMPPAVVRVQANSRDYTVNGVVRTADVAPFIDPVHDRTMVPLRFVAEALDAEVDWDYATRTATVNRGDSNTVLWVDQPLPNGMGMPVIIDGRIFVPVRYVAQMFGASVRWDRYNRATYITR